MYIHQIVALCTNSISLHPRFVFRQCDREWMREKTFISILPFFYYLFFSYCIESFFFKDEILSFLTDKKKSKNIQSVFLASTRGKIYSGVLDLSEGKGDITKKTLKENEKVN